MPLFKVTVRGRGLWIDIDGDVQRVGFRVTRVVEAEDERGAERKAVTLVRNDRKALPLPGKRSPMLTVEKIVRTRSAPAVDAGFMFCPDTSSRE
jgi:hypothetical protein